MKNRKLLKFLVLLHIVIITISNFLVSIPIEIFGIKLTWAAFSFPLVVVATDLTVRLVGKSIATKTISLPVAPHVPIGFEDRIGSAMKKAILDAYKSI